MMPVFTIETPAGKRLTIEADDEATAIRGAEEWHAQNGKPSVRMDVIKNLGAGVVEGTADIAGQPRDIASFALNKGLDAALFLGNKARGLMGLSPVEPTPEQRADFNRGINAMTPLGGGQDMRRRAEEVAGPLPQAETTAGEYARTVGRFLPGAAMTPVEGPMSIGTMGGNLFKYGVVPGVASEAAGQATEGTAAEPYARIAGALVGSQAVDAGKRLITPNPISPERQKLVDTLQREGVDLTAGQKTGRTGLKYLESASAEVPFGGGKAAAIADRQGEQFTAAALRRAGVSAERATPEVIDKALTNIGKEFDTLAANTTVKPDQQLGVDLFDTLSSYFQRTSTAERKPYIEKIVNDISLKAQRGQIEGAFYKTVRSDLERAGRNTTNPEFKEALRGVREALDDAVERSMPADIVDRWRDVRTQYRNLLPIERTVTGAGEKAAEGLISPSALRNSVVQMQGRRNYARGEGDFAELARAGEAVMRPLPNSGTAGRTQANNVLGGFGVGTLVGAGAGGAVGGVPGGVAGALAGRVADAVLPATMSRALMSRPVQGYLGNQLLAGETDPARIRLMQALMAVDAARREPTP